MGEKIQTTGDSKHTCNDNRVSGTRVTLVLRVAIPYI